MSCVTVWLADLDFLVDLQDHFNTLNKRLINLCLICTWK